MEGGEKDHQIVDESQHSNKLLEDVDVENCDIKVSHCVLGEGKDVVSCAENVNQGNDKAGDKDVVDVDEREREDKMGLTALTCKNRC